MKYIRNIITFLLLYFLISTAIYAQGWKNLNQIAEGNNLLGVAWATNDIAIAVGTNATLLRTADAGIHWSKIDIGYTRKSIRAVRFFDFNYTNTTGVHTTIGIAVGAHGGIYTADALYSDDTKPIILLTTDNGLTWTSQTTDNGAIWTSEFFNIHLRSVDICIDPVTNTPKAIAVGTGGRVLVGTNITMATPTWTYLTPTAGDPVLHPELPPELPLDILQLVADNKNITCIKFFSGTNPVQGIITGEGGYVLRTNDAGAHWATYQSPLTSIPAAWVGWSNHRDIVPPTANVHNNPDNQAICLSVNTNGDCLTGGQGSYADNNGVLCGSLVWSSNFGEEWKELDNTHVSHFLSKDRLRIGDVTSCHLYNAGNFIFSGHYGRILSSNYTINNVIAATSPLQYHELPYTSYTETILEPQETVTFLAVSPNEANIIAVGWYGNIWRKIGSNPWINCMNTPASTITLEGLNSTQFVSTTSTTEGWAVGNKWTLLHATSTDGGTTWNWNKANVSSIITTEASDLRADLRSVFFLTGSSNIGWIAGEGGVIFNTTNNGQTWVRQNPGIHNYHLNSVYFRDQQIGWAVGSDNTVLFTSDGGTTWTSNPISATTLIGSTPVTIDPKTIYYRISESVESGSSRTIIVGENIILHSDVLQTPTSTCSWKKSDITFQTSLTHNLTENYDLNGDRNGANPNDGSRITPRYWIRSVKQFEGNKLFAVGYMYNGASKSSLGANPYQPGTGLILYSDDNGVHWYERVLRNDTRYSFNQEVFIPQNLFDIAFQGNQAWIVGSNGYIIHSINPQSNVSHGSLIRWGEQTGIHKEQLSNTQWNLTSVSAIPGSSGTPLMAVGGWGTILTTTNGGGLGKAAPDEDPIQTGNPVNLNSPTLFQNVPNPFSQSTTISFHIPNRSHVNLSIVDGLGRTISVLTDGMIEPGEHSVNYEPAKISSGVYYCRLNVDGYIEIKPMMVVR
ncbi:MAG: hypothetical protein HYZ54_08640 [Ignavibacteriae bacterium]|nr:hypothetical protein [Ignavibacteriota bacterium]